MKNKVLIKLIIPEMDLSYNLFIPVNEVVWKIKKLMIKSISDMSGFPVDISKEFYLFNKDTCNFYNNNEIVIYTDIRNSSELILLSKV